MLHRGQVDSKLRTYIGARIQDLGKGVDFCVTESKYYFVVNLILVLLRKLPQEQLLNVTHILCHLLSVFSILI